MLFPTIDFAIFFAVVFTVQWLLNPYPGPWKAFMVVASYFFYAWWDWRFIFLLAASTAIAHIGGGHRPGHRDDPPGGAVDHAGRAARTTGLVQVLRVPGRQPRQRDPSWAWATRAPAPVTLPVGISFFTFMAISYVVDIYRGVLKPARAIDITVYLSFFPHLVAGPIVRGTELLPQIRRRRDDVTSTTSRPAG